MSKNKWHDKKLADHIVSKISELIIGPKNPNNGFSYSLTGFKTKFNRTIEDYQDILVLNARFNSDVPNKMQTEIVRKSIFTACDMGKSHSGVISEKIKSLEKDYLHKPKNTYCLLKTISILYGSFLKKVSINNATITFHKRKPKYFENEDADKMACSIVGSEILKNFTYVKVRVSARCENKAIETAATEFDFIRGIWNFTINKKFGIRKTLSGLPMRINKIVCGPCCTVHKNDGSRESGSFWHDTNISREFRILDIQKEYDFCKKDEVCIRKKSKHHSMGFFIKKIFIRYASSLDDENMTNTFIRLWSLLELVTKTENANYSITIQRASLIFIDKQTVKITLNNLRNKRNDIIHSGRNFDSSEQDSYSLLSIINSIILFLLDNINSFKNIKKYEAFLSLPLNKKEMEHQQKEIHDKLKIFELAQKLNVYS
ncbi:MAG: hypothetical protein GY874_22105 [Desulfobacteraceae bacterium]|nr:hypothetical protein [Desulfobacteraceae bacterium]